MPGIASNPLPRAPNGIATRRGEGEVERAAVRDTGRERTTRVVMSQRGEGEGR